MYSLFESGLCVTLWCDENENQVPAKKWTDEFEKPRRLKSQVVRDAAEEELKEILDQLKTIIRNLYFSRFDYGESIMRVKPSLYIVHLMYSGSFLIVRCNNLHKLRVGGVFLLHFLELFLQSPTVAAVGPSS